MANSIGSSFITNMETIIVAIKVTILCLFVVASLSYIDYSVFAPSNLPSTNNLLSSLAITYFAYTGFAVVTNSAGELQSPKTQLPRAIYLAIGFTIILYVGLSIVVFGNLSVSDVIKYKDTALAQAAKPIFGEFGFKIIGFSAILATASALNATMFAMLNITDEEAKDDEISTWFLQRTWRKGTTGISLESAATIILANFVDLSSIASLASLCVISVTMMVHLGHLYLKDDTKASGLILWFSIISNFLLIFLFIRSAFSNENYNLISSFITILICFLFEKLNQHRDKKKAAQ